jgi:hypothetical protein
MMININSWKTILTSIFEKNYVLLMMSFCCWVISSIGTLECSG